MDVIIGSTGSVTHDGAFESDVLFRTLKKREWTLITDCTIFIFIILHLGTITPCQARIGFETTFYWTGLVHGICVLNSSNLEDTS